MHTRRTIHAGVLAAVFFLSPAFADKTSVEIQAPESAAIGSKITVTVRVIHEGNNFFHYTDWVYLKANGKEIALWEFTRGARPESEVFSRQVEYTVNGPVEFEAQGHCNIHGSTGSRKLTVKVR
ncbi:MAG: hypothetical protein JW838_04405 [Spirochaetes bacterium]|nr:hypothetical protein [Spirochaetota bacterium]